MKSRAKKIPNISKRFFLLLILIGTQTTTQAQKPADGFIEIWHGEIQRVGHLGDAQDDFNLLGHVEPWREIDRFTWRIEGRRPPAPVSYHSYRRIVDDGDFNIDIPVGSLKPDTNKIILSVLFRDGTELEKFVKLIKEEGSSGLPYNIVWDKVKKPQDVGQIVDGKWEIVKNGLRTMQAGYDRIFLIGERDWQDYEVLTSITVHYIVADTHPSHGGGAVGILFRFTGHVTGGHRHFASGQPKWGYQPFGAITWIQWERINTSKPPLHEFYPGDTDRAVNFEPVPFFKLNKTLMIRSACETLPDEDGQGVTRYSFKIWEKGTGEPEDWDWQYKQKSQYALQKGGVALLAHYVDVTFGDVQIVPR